MTGDGMGMKVKNLRGKTVFGTFMMHLDDEELDLVFWVIFGSSRASAIS